MRGAPRAFRAWLVARPSRQARWAGRGLQGQRCAVGLAALDVHPRIAMAILRHSRIALTMEIYTQVPDKVTRDALKRLGDLLYQGDEASS